MLIRVLDQGHGIDPSLVHLLFQPCLGVSGAHSSPCAVARMGLWIVKQLVELHGGAVSVESAGLGRGTTVTVRLPMRTRVATASEPLPAPPTLLVVDDAALRASESEETSASLPLASSSPSTTILKPSDLAPATVAAGSDET
jgi:hypothetical protein